jgi:iron-sulfur cluster assembly accessory protein
MIITKQALQKLQERVASAEVWGARLSITGGGCGGYMYELSYEDMPGLTDIVYQNILAVDSTSSDYLKEAKLTWQINGVQEEFIIENTKLESGRCGCGESFYME